jgi:hypothetical protein
MAIEDKVETYSVRIAQDNFLNIFRSVRLSLESGGTAFIAFPKVRPANWLELNGASTNLFMTEDQFDDVYRVLQTESPVFFTALNLFGLQIGAVHTELDLGIGEPPGEGETDAQSLEALVRRARSEAGVSAGEQSSG